MGGIQSTTMSAVPTAASSFPIAGGPRSAPTRKNRKCMWSGSSGSWPRSNPPIDPSQLRRTAGWRRVAAAGPPVQPTRPTGCVPHPSPPGPCDIIVKLMTHGRPSYRVGLPCSLSAISLAVRRVNRRVGLVGLRLMAKELPPRQLPQTIAPPLQRGHPLSQLTRICVSGLPLGWKTAPVTSPSGSSVFPPQMWHRCCRKRRSLSPW